ncbi:hypothetical protein ACC761_30790 [Rhizobium ruizarguesonis]
MSQNRRQNIDRRAAEKTMRSTSRPNSGKAGAALFPAAMETMLAAHWKLSSSAATTGYRDDNEQRASERGNMHASFDANGDYASVSHRENCLAATFTRVPLRKYPPCRAILTRV